MEKEPMNSYSPSLKNKIKQTMCLSCCFRSNRRETLEPPASSMWWLKTKVHEFPEMKEKCRNIFNRMRNHHRRHSSTDFHYDPLSYSLNFEDIHDDHHLDEVPLKNFLSRLPVSTPPIKEPSPPLLVLRVG